VAASLSARKSETFTDARGRVMLRHVLDIAASQP
jgi:hypothetical protein